jgi:hypothetical protein
VEFFKRDFPSPLWFNMCAKLTLWEIYRETHREGRSTSRHAGLFVQHNARRECSYAGSATARKPQSPSQTSSQRPSRTQGLASPRAARKHRAPAIASYTTAPFTQKGEPSGSPFFAICCVVSEATQNGACFRSDAHRESGVFQLSFSSKPGGVMLHSGAR